MLHGIAQLHGSLAGLPAMVTRWSWHPSSAGNTTDTGRISCKSQESELAVLWTLGIFALNFGPVLVGPVLDGLGPKWTAVLGEGSVSMSTRILRFSCSCSAMSCQHS